MVCILIFWIMTPLIFAMSINISEECCASIINVCHFSADDEGSTWCHNAEDHNVNLYCFDNLRPHITKLIIQVAMGWLVLKCGPVWQSWTRSWKKLKPYTWNRTNLMRLLTCTSSFTSGMKVVCLTLCLKICAPCTTSVVRAILYVLCLFNCCNRILCVCCIHY